MNEAPDTAEALPPSIAEPEALDFVCSNYVAAEKKHSAFAVPIFIGKGIVACALWIMALVVGIPAVFSILAVILFAFFSMVSPSEVSLSARLIILGCFATAALFVYGCKALLSEIKGFPTNVKITADGLSFAWRSKDDIESECIPWASIDCVSAHAPRRGHGAQAGREISASEQAAPALAGVVLCLDVKKSFFKGWHLYRALAQTRALWGIRVFLFSDLIGLNFPMDALTLDADKFRLMAAIRARAPEGAQEPSFLKIIESNKSPTYTQLWLDDMQSFRRQSVNELPAETILNDGRFKIIDKIASGGQAKIYKALDLTTGNTVALKELILPVNAGADVRNRSFANVKKEALLLSSLNHPGILKLLDNFVQDHRAYLVLEYIEGRTLRLTVQEDGPLDAVVAASIATMICDILTNLHGQSPPVVHRDLAPDNLMLTEAGQVVLLDFNVAQQLESNTTRTVVGKHNYMAPEQFKGKPTTQSDLYSLGGTLYYLLTGADPEPLTCSQPSALLQVPAGLDDIVAKLTSLKLADRYQTASEAAADLAAL